MKTLHGSASLTENILILSKHVWQIKDYNDQN